MRPLLPPAALLAVLLTGCDRPSPAFPTDDAAPAGPSVAADSLVVADSALQFFVAFGYPQLRDAGPHTDAVNRALADSARAVVERFRPDGPPDPGFPFETTVGGGYDVVRLDRHVFSAAQDLYFYTGGAHGNTDTLPLNYDLTTGRAFGLAALFRPGTAYLDTLSARTAALVRAEAAAAGLSPDDFWEEGWAPETGNFARFALGADTLHLYFPPYQIAPYAAGPFAFGLPLGALRSLLDERGPATLPR